VTLSRHLQLLLAGVVQRGGSQIRLGSDSAFVFGLFEEHGLPDPDDPEFSSNEAVVNRVLAFCQREFKKEPAASTVRIYVPRWISAYSERISRN
jgi:hypothetical protein